MSERPTLIDHLLRWMMARRIRGVLPLVRLLKRNQPSLWVRARSRHGLLLNLDPTDYIDSIVLRKGYYEAEVLEALLAHAQPGDVVWDIGANIGLHSLTLKRLRPEVDVACFEPSPFAFSRLYWNARLNGVDLARFTLFNVALADSPGYRRLALLLNVNSGSSSFADSGKGAQYAMSCFCDTAARMVEAAAVAPPNIVKIDVENFEYAVLSGFGALLSDARLRVIVFESPPGADERPDSHPVHRLLRSAGFEISALAPADPSVKSVATNYLARRAAASNRATAIAGQ